MQYHLLVIIIAFTMVYCSSEQSFRNSSSQVNESLEPARDEEAQAVDEPQTIEDVEEEDSEDITATRPVVISGSYLTCQVLTESPNESNTQVSCHFEKDGSVIDSLVIRESDVSFTINNSRAVVQNFKSENGVFTFEVPNNDIISLTISVDSIDGEAIGEDLQSDEPTKTVAVLSTSTVTNEDQEPEEGDDPPNDDDEPEEETPEEPLEQDEEQLPDLSLSNLTVSTGKAYQIQDSVGIDSELYIDRDYRFTSLGEFEGSMFIQTSNEDDGELTDSLITFNINRSAEILVLFDVRADSLPTWLASWELLPSIIETNIPKCSRNRYFNSCDCIDCNSASAN
ncbi:MAG: hypothetical protein HRU09_18230 [Oligoflexales bacterium]|nr:hypothetical protein [Oligoflexales bacterium]